MKMLHAISLSALFAVVPALAQEQSAAPVAVEDVEELLDNIGGYANDRVAVSGEIEEHIDPRSFVLESGGLFNDEITVIMPAGAEGLDPTLLREDSDVVVIGTLRTVPVVEIEREFGWDFDPEIEAELEDVRTYLIAEKIERY